jgi:preprotein translocase subunit SecA
LDCLTEAEKKTISEDYNLKKFTYAPSIYDESKLQFKKNGNGVVLTADGDRYHQTLAKEIIDEREKGRPVLVYFEAEDKMEAFLGSDYGKRLQDIVCVTEKKENIPYYVNKATGWGMVTMFPRVFGRGLDFVSRDPAVDDAGGVCVLQTFFSQYLSEEIQIRGRAARQKKKGSFKMILLLDDLLHYGLTADELNQCYSTNTFYDTIDAKRSEAITFRVKELADKARNARSLHEKSIQFLKLLHDPSHSHRGEIVDAMLSF